MRRKMQITVSYLCLTLCVAVVTLWAHSYVAYVNGVLKTGPQIYWYADSWEGRLTIFRAALGFRDALGPAGKARTALYVTSTSEAREYEGRLVDSGGILLIDRAKAFDLLAVTSNSAGGLWALRFPHWLPSVLFAGFAIVARPSPRFRFNLRDLFAFMTIATVTAAGFAALLRLADASS